MRVTTNLLGIVLAYLLGYMFLRSVLKHLLAPVDKLTDAMGQIIDHEQYSLRVEKTSNDELGKLTDGRVQLLHHGLIVHLAGHIQGDELLLRDIQIHGIAIVALKEGLEFDIADAKTQGLGIAGD